MRAIIGTWKMSYQGVAEGFDLLLKGDTAGNAVEHAIKKVEDEPSFQSVGFGGLPNQNGRVTLDSAYMDGKTLRFGAIMSAENIQNPISVARRLCGRETNCVLAAEGAEQFAIQQGLPMKDMRTDESLRQWHEALMQTDRKMDAYNEHDTVCVIALDDDGTLVTGTSTSGLFMKQAGRVGDSPIVGSGFYCDARYGAAAATGLGEDIMRGCLSYEIVSLIRNGLTPQQACENAVSALASRKIELGEDAGAISVIAMSIDGSFGAATTLPVFPFVAGSNTKPCIWAARPEKDGTMNVYQSSDAELAGEP